MIWKVRNALEWSHINKSCNFRMKSTSNWTLSKIHTRLSKYNTSCLIVQKINLIFLNFFLFWIKTMRYSKHSSLILLTFITREYNDKFKFIFMTRIFKRFEVKIIWCCYLIRASFSFFEIDSKKRVKTFVLTLREFDWYMILKLYSKKISVQRVWRRMRFLFVMKIFKTL